MTNLDSIFKSRDITLPTKIYLVKAMVFPVVMYGCESWTVKKAEHLRIDAFVWLVFNINLFILIGVNYFTILYWFAIHQHESVYYKIIVCSLNLNLIYH